jgi:hypothetical protein
MSGNDSDDDEPSSVKIPVFRGTDEKWDVWKAQFKAYAHHKGFLKVLLGDEVAEPETTVITEKGKLRIRKANDTAYASLIMACKSGAFGHVNGARDKDFPNGSAKLAWDKMVKVYESNTMSDMVELMDKWSKCTLDGDSNPDVWFNDLAQIRERLTKTKAPISDETAVAHIITKLPESYRPLVVGLKLSSTVYSVEDIQKEVRDFWNRFIKNKQPTANSQRRSRTLRRTGKVQRQLPQVWKVWPQGL